MSKEFLLRRRQLIAAQGGLPSAYQAVEWIKNNEKQYINTGILTRSGLTITYRVKILENKTVTAALFGARKTMSTQQLAIFINNQRRLGYRYGDNRTTSYGSSAIDMNWHTVKVIGNSCYVDDVFYASVTANDFIGEYPIYVFGIDTGGVYDTVQILQQCAQSFIVEENGKEIMHLVACVRKADNKPGMYDLVSRNFLVNKNTGKDFTPGDPI